MSVRPQRCHGETDHVFPGNRRIGAPVHELPGPSSAGVDRIVVFGDSLSDSGNAGRSSNGPVWVEYLAKRFGVALKPSRAGGLNFSVGGARLSRDSGPISLRAQADAYLRSNDRAANTLHIVYGGGNDVLEALGHPHADAMIRAAVESPGPLSLIS